MKNKRPLKRTLETTERLSNDEGAKLLAKAAVFFIKVVAKEERISGLKILLKE